jgi:hypothetical protein
VCARQRNLVQSATRRKLQAYSNGRCRRHSARTAGTNATARPDAVERLVAGRAWQDVGPCLSPLHPRFSGRVSPLASFPARSVLRRRVSSSLGFLHTLPESAPASIVCTHFCTQETRTAYSTALPMLASARTFVTENVTAEPGSANSSRSTFSSAAASTSVMYCRAWAAAPGRSGRSGCDWPT